MTTRRSFIQIATCATVTVGAGLAEAAQASILSRPGLHTVLIESEQAASGAFGARLGTHGSKVLSIPEGDITAAWLQVLRPAWARGPVAVGGLTSPSALFCLEQLAWSQGLRVVFHAEHVLLPDGKVEHTLHRGAQQASLDEQVLATAGVHWPARVADALATRRIPGSARRSGPSLAALEPTLPKGARLLTSWVIAAA